MISHTVYRVYSVYHKVLLLGTRTHVLYPLRYPQSVGGPVKAPRAPCFQVHGSSRSLIASSERSRPRV